MPVTEYLESIVRPLLSHPESLYVSQKTDEMGVLLTIDVHKEDMGIIIGKGGDTAKAIRSLVRIAGMRSKQRVSIKINEPNGLNY